MECATELVHGLAILAALLFCKHLAADGPLQTRFQLANKGRFLHPGGLIHAGIHAGLSGICLLGWMAWMTGSLGAEAVAMIAAIIAGEAVIHYCTDFAKVRLDGRYTWSVVEVGGDGTASMRIVSNFYFIAFLADQTVHSLTYVGIVYVASTTLLGSAGAAICAGIGA